MGFRTVIGFEMTDRAAGYDPAAVSWPAPGSRSAGNGAADDRKGSG